MSYFSCQLNFAQHNLQILHQTMPHEKTNFSTHPQVATQ